MPSKPSRNTLIHCAACGEDYSPTYRRCPFCGAVSYTHLTLPTKLEV